jgi:DNA repair exonuclease SbcCD ATPase subunit
MMQQYQAELDQLSKDVADVSRKLETQSGASIESGRAQVDALRQRLIQLGAQLQPDAPLLQNTERFQSWISAQLGRVNGQRQTLGVEFVEQLVKRYQQYQQEVTAEREELATGAKAINQSYLPVIIYDHKEGCNLMKTPPDCVNLPSAMVKRH